MFVWSETSYSGDVTDAGRMHKRHVKIELLSFLSLSFATETFVSKTEQIFLEIWGEPMFWIGYRGSWLLVCFPPAKPPFNTPHYWRRRWSFAKQCCLRGLNDWCEKSGGGGILRCFLLFFGRTGRATLIPAPVSKCPFSRTWLDKSPLKWPNGPHGSTLSNPGVKRASQKFGFHIYQSLINCFSDSFKLCTSLWTTFLYEDIN